MNEIIEKEIEILDKMFEEWNKNIEKERKGKINTCLKKEECETYSNGNCEGFFDKVKKNVTFYHCFVLKDRFNITCEKCYYYDDICHYICQECKNNQNFINLNFLQI